MLVGFMLLEAVEDAIGTRVEDKNVIDETAIDKNVVDGSVVDKSVVDGIVEDEVEDGPIVAAIVIAPI